jgi:phosphatidylserine/phosphatidylglycerophosphate/cardiolipin synthase-like enzyme
VGSINGSEQAFFSNREFGIFFDDSESVQLLAATFKKDFHHSGVESWQESIQCREYH